MKLKIQSQILFKLGGVVNRIFPKSVLYKSADLHWSNNFTVVI